MKRLFNALRYSLQGLQAAYRGEAAFRQEVVLALVLVPLAFYLAESGVELAWLIFPLIIVFVAELCNTAIEALADTLTREQHPGIKKAKDAGSAAVFVSLTGLVFVWIVIISSK